jgi:hypothetical protein
VPRDLHDAPPVRSELRTTLVSSAALTTAVLPVFLLGASSDAIRAELGIGEAGIGAVVTVLFVTGGAAATGIGRVTERVGAAVALRAGVVLAGGATASMGLFARAWWHLAVLGSVVGLAVALIDTGAARAFADRVTRARQGRAFGIKEASVPGASLLAGLALPTVAAQLGWRATFVAALAVAAFVFLALPGAVGRGRRSLDAGAETSTAPPGPELAAPDPVAPGTAAPSGHALRLGPLVLLATGVGLGAAAANAAATFLVPAFTVRGTPAEVAGVVLATASIASIVARVAAGRWADGDRSRAAAAVAVLLAAGAVGAVLLAVPLPVPIAAAGSVLLLGGGWGWTGLAFVAVVRARPEAAATSAGIVLTGLGLGGALGPLGFGWAVGVGSYPVAWWAVTTVLVVAAVATGVASRAVDAARV